MPARKKTTIAITVVAVAAVALWLIIDTGTLHTNGAATPSANTSTSDTDTASAGATKDRQTTEAKKPPQQPKPPKQLTVNAAIPSDDKPTAELRQLLGERFVRFSKSVRDDQMQAVLGVIYDLQLERDALDQDQDAVTQAAIEDPRNPRPVPHVTWAEEARALADAQISRILSPEQYDEYKRKISPMMPSIIRLRMVQVAPPNPQGA